MYCKNCNSEIPDSAKFCPKCGSPVIDSAQTIDPAKQEPSKKQNDKKNNMRNTLITVIVCAAAVVVVLVLVLLPRENSGDLIKNKENVAIQSEIEVEYIEENAEESMAENPLAIEAEIAEEGKTGISEESEGNIEAHDEAEGKIASEDVADTTNTYTKITMTIYEGSDIDECVKYIYDSNQLLISEIYYDAPGGCAWHTINYNYDENGNVITELEKWSSDSCYLYEYSYDENGNLPKVITHSRSVGSESTVEYIDKYTYDYTYDENGNMTLKILRSSEKYDDYGEYVYDENGNMILAGWRYSDYDDYEDYDEFVECTYNENDNVISVDISTADKWNSYIIESYKFTYGENSNLASGEWTDSYGHGGNIEFTYETHEMPADYEKYLNPKQNGVRQYMSYVESLDIDGTIDGQDIWDFFMADETKFTLIESEYVNSWNVRNETDHLLSYVSTSYKEDLDNGRFIVYGTVNRESTGLNNDAEYIVIENGRYKLTNQYY